MGRVGFILLFDVPLNERSLARKIQRDLNRAGAKMLQQSVWKFNNLRDLIEIATIIKKSGGDARILEERFVF